MEPRYIAVIVVGSFIAFCFVLAIIIFLITRIIMLYKKDGKSDEKGNKSDVNVDESGSSCAFLCGFFELFEDCDCDCDDFDCEDIDCGDCDCDCDCDFDD